jgi:hypothetical protein
MYRFPVFRAMAHHLRHVPLHLLAWHGRGATMRSQKMNNARSPGMASRGFCLFRDYRGWGQGSRGLVPKDRKQDDDGNWDAQQPKKYTSTHPSLLLNCQRLNAVASVGFPPSKPPTVQRLLKLARLCLECSRPFGEYAALFFVLRVPGVQLGELRPRPQDECFLFHRIALFRHRTPMRLWSSAAQAA